MKNKKFVISEWKYPKIATEVEVFIYEMAARSIDANELAKENYELCKKLREKNIVAVAYKGRFIASFEELDWEEIEPKFISKRIGPIDLSNELEITLLEYLIKQDLFLSINNTFRNIYKVYNNLVFLPNSETKYHINNEIEISPYIKFDVNISKQGEVLVGFDIYHQMKYKKPISHYLNELKEGVNVIDYLHNRYKFVKVEDYTVSDELPVLGSSIIEYYQQKGTGIVNYINPNSKVVSVKTNRNALLPYAPELLYLEASYENIKSQYYKSVSKVIKLSPFDRINIYSKDVKIILRSYKRFSYFNNLGNMNAKDVGYEVSILNRPELVFRNNYIETNIYNGLVRGGSFENRKIELNFLFEDKLYEELENNRKYHPITIFMKELKELSNKLGIELKNGSHDKIIFDEINFIQHVRQIKELGSPVLIFATSKNADKFYSKIKKEITGVMEIASQIVTDKVFESKGNRVYMYLNTLLGIYAKADVQPWILHNDLGADVYIGLDVSHDDGLHSSGIVQIIDKNGRILSSDQISGVEKGEIINKQTLEAIIENCITKFLNKYDRLPTHFVFHRDGKGHQDEIQSIKELLKPRNITFDYVSIIKNANRRMLVVETKGGQIKNTKTELGLVYLKEQLAYLTSTDPRETIGTAKPIKVQRLYGETNLNTIIQDIYDLSYMHIHSMLKTRLPITIYYADLSSTAYNRGYLPRGGSLEGLPFV